MSKEYLKTMPGRIEDMRKNMPDSFTVATAKKFLKP
jgi:hypothetical protein